MPVAGSLDRVDASELLTLTTAVGLGLSAAPAFHACLDEALDDPACRTLIVDLSGVLFMGARAAGTLGRAYERARGQDVRLAVVADTRSVLRALRSTGASGVEIVSRWSR